MTREIEADRDLLLSSSETQSNRWYYEQEKLRAFPAFKLLATGGQITAAQGALDTQANNTYGIRIELQNYPYALPKIFPKDWAPLSGCPHKFTDGSLCIMRTAQWRSHFTIALVVAKTAIWLAKYEIWRKDGYRWPGLQQGH